MIPWHLPLICRGNYVGAHTPHYYSNVSASVSQMLEERRRKRTVATRIIKSNIVWLRRIRDHRTNSALWHRCAGGGAVHSINKRSRRRSNAPSAVTGPQTRPRIIPPARRALSASSMALASRAPPGTLHRAAGLRKSRRTMPGSFRQIPACRRLAAPTPKRPWQRPADRGRE